MGESCQRRFKATCLRVVDIWIACKVGKICIQAFQLHDFHQLVNQMVRSRSQKWSCDCAALVLYSSPRVGRWTPKGSYQAVASTCRTTCNVSISPKSLRCCC